MPPEHQLERRLSRRRAGGQRRIGHPRGRGAFVTINQRDREALAYARVTVPLGKQPKRIDCSRVYELEIERLREEVALLRMGAQ